MFTVSASQDGEKCFVPGCSTEYDSNKAAEAELATRGNPTSIFLFLKDDIIRKQRLQNISRDAEDKPQAKRYVCSLHLKKTDYYTSKVCRGTERQVRSLKTGALPTVFDNSSYPFYMKDASVRNRTTTMSSSVARREGEWNHHGQETEAWPALDKFTNLPDLKEKMADDLLPGFMLSLDMDVMGEMQYLTFFTYEPQQDLMPAMDNILRIRDDGTFVMYKHGARIPKGRLRAIIRDHKDHFTMVGQVTNAVAFLKNIRVEDSEQIEKVEEVLAYLDLENLTMEHQQLLLKNNNRYTNEFFIKFAILCRSSPKMYRPMRKEMV